MQLDETGFAMRWSGRRWVETLLEKIRKKKTDLVSTCSKYGQQETIIQSTLWSRGGNTEPGKTNKYMDGQCQRRSKCARNEYENCR